MLAVRSEDCSGTELACNDDDSYTLQSRLEVYLYSGQTVTIVVSGYSGDTGNFVLNVN